MSDADSKVNSPETVTPPETDDSGNPDAEQFTPPNAMTAHVAKRSPRHQRPPRRAITVRGKLERLARRFSERLKCHFAEEIRQDPRSFKKRVVTLVRRALPPFGGRPPENAIDRAIELRKLGQRWKEVYAQVIPDHAHLDSAARCRAESNLRAALRSRRNARKRRNRARSKFAEAT